MSKKDFTDNSYPPIGSELRYQRGDGAVVTLKIEKNGVATPVANGHALTPQPRHLLDLFSDDPAVPARPAPAPQLAPEAALETRGEQHPVTVAQRPGGAPEFSPDLFNHPDVGGKFTICVLFYGPEAFYDLHRRCLESIITTVPLELMDLRVASNALNPRSLQMIEQYVQCGVIRKHYRHVENAYKYPVMHEMFYDPDLPIETKWVIWFDDDSIADRTASWLELLAQSIIQNHRQHKCHMFGSKKVWTLQSGQRAWYEARSWFKKRAWQMQNGRGSPNGNKIHFAEGGWWAITTEAIRACGIPDPEIGHNGGDYTIGCQLYQGGYEIKQFNANKQFIHTSSVDRRGVTTAMPGMSRVIPAPKPKRPVTMIQIH